MSDSLTDAFRAHRASAEYRRAVEHDDEARDFPFMGLPEVVCGIELRPLTMLDLTALFHLRSPFLSSRFRDGTRKPIPEAPTVDLSGSFWSDHILVTHGAIAQFLWIQSTAFAPREGTRWNQFKAERKRTAFVRRFCRRLKYGEACEGIRSYVNDAFEDKPGGAKSGPSKPAQASWMASEVYFIAKHYPSFTESQILNMPLRRLFQYERAALAANGKPEALSSRAERLDAEFLKRAKAEMARN